jgi:hypothetical protein
MDLQFKRRISVIIFLLGALTGIIFSLFMVWAQFEASLWNETPTEDEALDGFTCPLMVTSGEYGVIRIEYENPLDRTINPVIRTYITQGLISLQREEATRPEILAGETTRLEYTVVASDAVWNRFIFVRAYALPQFTLPSRSGSCGILVVDLPLPNGWMVVILALLISVGGMGGGIWLWYKVNFPFSERANNTFRAMVFLAAITVLGLVLELLSIWGLATLVLLFTFIMMAALIGYYLALA